MKLHHFCRASDLDSITEKGLYPHVPTDPIMSLGEEVVWLTTQETAEVDETDVEHLHRLGLPKEQIAQIAQNGWLLDTNRTHRLTVRIRSGGRLKQYGEWLHSNRDRPIIENGVGHANDDGELYSAKHLIERLSPNALRTWWDYFGRIAPSKIEGLPPRQAKRSAGAAEDTAAHTALQAQLDIALNKLIRSETATVAP
jgi:hypothetical protein